MAYSASTDLTAAWYAAAPPPPPPAAAPASSQASSSPRSATSSQPTVYGMHKSSSSNSSLGFDKRAKGDSFPHDSHSPEPERPVSRNAMAKVREKERLRARTNSTSYVQRPEPPAVPYGRPDQAVHAGHSYESYYQQAGSVARERHDSSPATAAPWSTYPQQQQQQQHQHQPASYEYTQPSHQAAFNGYYPSQAYAQPSAWPHGVAHQPMYGAPPQQQLPTSYENPVWPTMSPAPGSFAPSPIHAAAVPHGYQSPAAPMSSVAQPAWMEQNTSIPQSQYAPVPFPTNPMPPPTAPASAQHTTIQAHPYSHPMPSGARPLPSPSRSSSQSSSVGTGPSSPSLGSISGTVRRSLPQPPGKPIAQAGADPSPLGRHDSVRMAAEELMSRGPPRRKNMSVGSRFAASPHVSKSEGSINEGATVPEQQQQRSGIRVARAESASCLEKEMRELKLKQEERRQSMSSHRDSVIPPHQEIVRAASPRPVRAAPQPAPEVQIATPVEEVIPARPVSRGPKDERERRQSTTSFEATAAQIPVIFSPPPDSKPPVPTICFEETPVIRQAGMPSIVLPGDGVPDIQVGGSPSIQIDGPPSIDVQPPVIHVNSDSSEDSEESEGPKASISISVSSSSMAQRSTTSTNASGTASGHPSHHHQHHNHHSHGHEHPRPAAPASASSVGSGASCATCQKWIGGRVVHAMSHTFHPDCFVCCHCSEHLEHVAFYEHEGRPYCHFDYHELFSKRCFHCRTPIVDQRYITINDVDLVGGNAEERCYHDLHFFCANCGDPFLDPKVASSAAGSDPMEMVEDDDGKVRFGGREFVVHKGYPYCEKCHVNLHKPRCKGCKKPILETDFLTALKAKWHLHCFCCQFCSKPISSENFFVKNGQAFDEECYKIKLRSEL